MRKYIKRVLSLIFASVLMINLLQTNVYAEKTVDTEEKVYSGATLEDEFADNRVLVVLDNETSLAVDQFEGSMFAGINCNRIESLTTAKEAKVQEKMSSIAAELNDVAVARNAAEIVTAENIMKIAAADEELSSYKQVLCIELEESGKDKVLEAIAELEKQENVLCAEPDYVHTLCSTTPNDPYYTDDSQWAIDIISLPQAWDTTTGSSSVKVAIIDSGIDGDHVDLTGRIDTNLCRDFTSGSVVAVGTPTDSNGHGTMVAGIIGAIGNNGRGVTGTCWNVRLVSLKTFVGVNSYTSYVASAIDFAQSNNIPIVNYSGGRNSDVECSGDALYTAIENYSGLVVCAAGNEAYDIDNEKYRYPSNYNLNNIICVGASGENDEKWEYSNHGVENVDIFAPGIRIWSTSSTGGYTIDTGTSYATPYVSGVAALLRSMDSSLTAAEIKEAILSGADKISALNEYCVTGGRLNAHKALFSEAAHNFVSSSPINAANHRSYCSGCASYFIRMHTFSGSDMTCTECGYHMELMK